MICVSFSRHYYGCPAIRADVDDIDLERLRDVRDCILCSPRCAVLALLPSEDTHAHTHRTRARMHTYMHIYTHTANALVALAWG